MEFADLFGGIVLASTATVAVSFGIATLLAYAATLASKLLLARVMH